MPRSIRVLFVLVMRDLATRYEKSSLGYLWAVLEPIGAIAILSLAFSAALKNPALGESFPPFYSAGYMPFMLYNTIQNSFSAASRENLQLLFYPHMIYIEATISQAALTLITQLLVAVIVFVGIIWIDNINQGLKLWPVLVALMVAAFLELGVGVLNLMFIYFWPSWRQVWSIITRPIFLVSCIFYSFYNLPIWVQDMLWFNPMIHITGETQIGFYTFYEGNYIALACPIVIGAVTFFLGLALLRRHAQDLINT